MSYLSAVLLATVMCMYAVNGDYVPNPADCNCGDWLGLHCGSRASVAFNKDALIWGSGCKPKGFYQCSEIQTKATFKGMCPNCRTSANENDNGRDVCLSPTRLFKN